MASTRTARRRSRNPAQAVLVVVGALGDWCVRRVLRQAWKFASDPDHRVADVILIDQRDPSKVDRWLVRRLIEQKAEEVDRVRCLERGARKSWLATGSHPLPNPTSKRWKKRPSAAFGVFKQRWRLDSVKEVRESSRTLSAWFTEPLKVSLRPQPLPRYWQSVAQKNQKKLTCRALGVEDEITGTEARSLSQRYRVIVYVATPPEAYLSIIKQWEEYADRIALEKPICGLLDKKDKVLSLAGKQSTVHTDIRNRIRDTAVDRATRNLPPLEVVTIDHYNSKWITHAIDFVRERHIIEYLLKRPQRILVQLCENDLLSRGRFFFYNSVGGAVADMVAHIMQPLRAITGYASAAEMLENLHIIDIRRAQYEVKNTLSGERPHPYKGEYDLDDADSFLLADTETFAEVQLRFISGKWTGVPVLIRTGKGVAQASKLLRVYGPDEGEGSPTVTFDFATNVIQLGAIKDGEEREWMRSVPFPIPDEGTQRDVSAPEYGEIFADLCKWALPDPRYFPSVSEAAKVYEFFRGALIRERHRGPITEPAYEPFGDWPFGGQ